jgi:hypothetical protein
MKRIFLFVFSAIVAFGCQELTKPDGYEIDNGCGLELKLVKMSSSWTGDQSTNDALEWQETITLRNDSSFLKRRIREGAVSEAAGRYIYVTLDDRHYVQLTYDQPESEMRTSCSPTELIEVKSSTQFKNTEWPACDGPALEYEAHATPCSE